MSAWELRVERLGFHKSGGKTRTYSRYAVLKDGTADPSLSGFMCESPGPGDNSRANNGKRIEPGTYPLWTQFGAYRSIGYATGRVAGEAPMPGIALRGTNRRIGILIHPAHPPKLFLSSTGCLNPTGALGPDTPMDFFDSRRRTIALIESLREHAPRAFAHEVMTRIGTATMTVIGNDVPQITASAVAAVFNAAAEPRSLPISKSAALQATDWLMQNFEGKLRAAVAGKSYGLKHLCAIVCQETAYKWVPWIGQHSADTIVERAVYDASGDYPGAPRSAFPANTDAFRRRYGPEFTNMLIEEANKTRRLQRYGDKPWVYKGYGLFQYDLQHVGVDEGFFRERLWYDFDVCLARATGELDRKLANQGGNLWEAIRAYNGSGPRARAYRDNVRLFAAYCAEITGD
ncbi:MAG TPA: hypothetical protein VEZ20_04055 [Allosphingosinicella sp.]|jgi:hypothetical protein|nr:hypothetical protein [Allosphingosinicella sp.]